MSVHVMSHVWKHSTYSGSELLTLLALADWADDEGVCWPSIKKLAAKSRQSDRSVQSAIRKFQKDGVLSIKERVNTSSVYRIDLSKISGAEISPGEKQPDKLPSRGEILAPNTSDIRNYPPPTSSASDSPMTGGDVGVVKPSKKRRSKNEIVLGFSEGTRKVVNTALEKWPKVRRGNQSPIKPDVSLCASRVEDILHSNNAITPDVLISGMDIYLCENKDFPHSPEFFFGPGKPNNGGPPWLAYARMAYHRLHQAVTQ